MSDQDLISKILGKSVNEAMLYNDKRLKLIENALAQMKKFNQSFLKDFQFTDAWSKINVSLVKNNIQSSLENLVEFKICETNKPDKSFFNPFSKKPITMCYNKFIKKEEFDKVLTYNLILYYDSKITKNMNWNDVSQVVVSNVRAMHLSKTCLQKDTKCIKQELEKRVFQKERFKGVNVDNLAHLIKQGIYSQVPFSQTC